MHSLMGFKITQTLYVGKQVWLGEGNGTPLQYSCLGNPMDGGTWQTTVHGVAKSQTRLSDFTYLLTQAVKNLPAMQETWV